MASSFAPTPAELNLVTAIFAQADPKKLGVLTGEVAVKVFAGAHLPPATLGEIWNLADYDNNGWLGKKGVAMAVRLIGWAQAGEKVSAMLLQKQGPPASIDGYATPTILQHNTGISISKSPPPGLPPLMAQDKVRFANLFKNAGPANGFLSGDRARDTFMKSKLPMDVLAKVWALADTQDRGMLDVVDFTVGMYFIQAIMKNQVSQVPSVLPPGLYQQAGGVVKSHPTGGSGSLSPVSGSFPQNRQPLTYQYTGQSQLQPTYTGLSSQTRAPQLPARPTPSAFISAPPSVINGQTASWDVTPSEKATSDTWFAGLDSHGTGYIEGDAAVNFMRQSNLPDEILAKIWDLADITGDGKLTKDGFAVAMHLIQKKFAGIEIPDVLPQSLIPPSLRKAVQSSPVAPPPVPEPVQDLFSWDDAPTPVSPAPVHQEIGKQPPAPITPRNFNGQPTTQDPFNSSPFNPPAQHRNLLDDDDDTHTTPQIHDHSAEIGNLRNQLTSTAKSLQTIQQERTSIERAVETQASELSSLQTQLAVAKAAHETETRLLATLRERHATQTTEIQKVRQELITEESNLSGMRVEKAEIEGAFLRDKEEARELHRKMIEASQQAEALKGEIDKSKKDAKQQKGLLAIARKQLSTKEADRAKALRELEESQAELAAISQEHQVIQAEIAGLDTPSIPNEVAIAASLPLPVTPEPRPATNLISPKSNNPFERLAISSGHSTPRSQSPFLCSPPAVNASLNDTFDFEQAFSTDKAGSAVPLASKTPLTEPDAHKSPVPKAANDVPSSTELPALNVDDWFNTPADNLDTNGNDIGTDPPRPHTPGDNVFESVFTSPIATRQSVQVTDLGSQLKELDAEESDSDNDSEDEIPLSALAKRKTPEPAAATTDPLVQHSQTAQPSDFDDIFSEPTTEAIKTQEFTTEPTDAFGMSLTSPSAPIDLSTTLAAQGPPLANGVNAFDETLGVIALSKTPETTLGFDGAFDDNFDFSSASHFPPVGDIDAAIPKTNGHTISPPGERNSPLSQSASLDLFTSLATASSNGTGVPAAIDPVFPAGPPPHVVAPTSPTRSSQSFEEAYAGLADTSASISGLHIPADSISSAPTVSHSASAPAVATASSQFTPFPTSPKSASTHITPISPPRLSSPKPRLSSSSSSKEVHDKHDKHKEAPPSRSKLSLRLPFGKKKNKAAPEPVPSLPITREEALSARSASPAVDGDIESVKQLVSMGFSRSVAVSALEKNDYDLQRAINSLV